MRTQTRVAVRKRARKGSFVAGTGLMGATEPGQRVTFFPLLVWYQLIQPPDCQTDLASLIWISLLYSFPKN